MRSLYFCLLFTVSGMRLERQVRYYTYRLMTETYARICTRTLLFRLHYYAGRI